MSILFKKKKLDITFDFQNIFRIGAQTGRKQKARLIPSGMRTGVEKNRSHPKGGDVTDTIQQVLYTAVGLVRNGLRYIIFYFYFPSLTKTLIFKLKNGIFLAGSKKSKAKQLYF